MITVKLYGLLRLDSGIKTLDADAKNTRELLAVLERQGLDAKLLRGCHILVNGELTSRHVSLRDGDTVQLFPPVAGG